MNSKMQYFKIKSKLSKRLKNLATSSFLTVPRFFHTPALASGKKYHPTLNLIDISELQQSIMTNTILHKLCSWFLLAGLGLFLFSSQSIAANVSLAWTASTSSNVGGYNVAYGLSSGNYTTTINVGDTTDFTVTGLQAGTTYYFAVNDYDTTDTVLSAYSNQVTYSVPAALTANFSESATTGAPGMKVSFTPITTGTVTSWAWAFPGSTTPSVTNTTAKSPTVTYPTSGTFSASLTVTGPSGSVTQTYPNLITVTASSSRKRGGQ